MYSEAKDTFEQVRAWYRAEKSLKSANKYYDVDRISDEDIRDKHGDPVVRDVFIKKALTKNQRRHLAEIELKNAFRTDATHGMPQGERTHGIPQTGDQPYAANCQQLTLACCSYAKSKYLLGKACVWVVNLKNTDHCFCVLGENFNKFNHFQFNTLALPVIAKELSDVYAIDVWMNFWCPASKYGAEANSKLTRWMGRGKQVLLADSIFTPDMRIYQETFKTDAISIEEFVT